MACDTISVMAMRAPAAPAARATAMKRASRRLGAVSPDNAGLRRPHGPPDTVISKVTSATIASPFLA
jgi:hypothetical protein